jgi:hypothetical protein
MTVIDTSLVIERVIGGTPIEEDITVITVIEYPTVLGYKGFYGKILYPEEKDLDLAAEIQSKLMKKGVMKGAADLVIAAIAINSGKALLTTDSDFSDISEVSTLRLL